MSNKQNEYDCDNKRLLKVEYPDLKEEDILSDTIVKQNAPTIYIRDIQSGETDILVYPFKGAYIEVEFGHTVDQNVPENFEQTIQDTIEAAIRQKLSCTQNLKMSGYTRIVYRIVYEMQGK